MSTEDVGIDIDELILDGPLGARAGAVREALGEHLGRLIAERGVPGSGGRRELHVQRASFVVSPEMSADAIAAQVAEGLYAQLAELTELGR
jgi:hypothetical protein